ncbi:hypothetical protein GCM10007416_33990 [Kroppenstedtia guangzhouensis]|uniref:Peptidase C51 domain-containing protein n=1 Tax=Kroppenstedtia guangzhouensis TaxID=1274356 RepID=A0ABQ1H3Y9_9BACL|nr:transglycosylase SLT domain-containing protein [Kroppenstedtia guangzhouensis]GGA57983.1 hypothetical protein GCM10007416_33990 [Kroppenstedtia guangzhouensis]
MEPSKAEVMARRVATRAIQGVVAKVAPAVVSVLAKAAIYALIGILIILIVWGLFYVMVGTFTAIFGPAAYEPPATPANVGMIESVQYADYINAAAKRHGVSPSLVAAVIRQESQFQKLAYNPRTKASGLMQLLPATAREMGAKDIFDPQQNIEAGTKYLAYLLERYNNNVKLALAAYNAGMGNVDKDLKAGGDGIPNFPETQAYVPNVLSYQKQYDKMVKEDGQIQFVSGGSGADNYPYKTANTSGADRWGFYIRQCTSFVAWRLNQAGIPFHNTMKGGRFGNAENWADNARRLGYTVNNKPAVGAVAQWNAGAFGHSGYGHVAYVTAVDGSKITIEEYNYKRFSYSRRTLPASQVSNYIHFQ